MNFHHAEAQIALDRDRENVEATVCKLRNYCLQLRERIGRYYGCMATAEKQRALVLQRQKMAELMDICDDFLSYMKDGEQPIGAWAQIDFAPMSEKERAKQELKWLGHPGPFDFLDTANTAMDELLKKL